MCLQFAEHTVKIAKGAAKRAEVGAKMLLHAIQAEENERESNERKCE